MTDRPGPESSNKLLQPGRIQFRYLPWLKKAGEGEGSPPCPRTEERRGAIRHSRQPLILAPLPRTVAPRALGQTGRCSVAGIPSRSGSARKRTPLRVLDGLTGPSAGPCVNQGMLEPGQLALLGCALQVGTDRCELFRPQVSMKHAGHVCSRGSAMQPLAAPQGLKRRRETGIKMEKDPRMAILRNPIGPFHFLAARLGR